MNANTDEWNGIMLPRNGDRTATYEAKPVFLVRTARTLPSNVSSL
jgi:hypothetical protein